MAVFQQVVVVVVSFGANAIMPIAYFSSRDVATLWVQHWMKERFQQLSHWWSGQEETQIQRSPLAAAGKCALR